ncbi:hypothetical protein AH135_001418 [Salmonella enterica subsp. enterica serovar Eastbourne]|nr:hypothetical protein [Salmonella enterica subsp. enterica serovar Eastbourne]
MQKEIFTKISVDCSTRVSTGKEIESLRYIISMIFSLLEQDKKEAIIYQLSQHSDNYSKKNLEMLLVFREKLIP